ncbi:DUF2804 domain-containing protein [Hoeflea sp. WL0058]|uniref:DUF2804 domain-containing protein n=1 Tax=Flavimaribacter sediminis TaxID=2865987 RepID=A0AAE2ZN11_9HYPH|nr:DUF2804 domain-containing protein [Flavimaribacter sediminis]MBW8639206.1 DUF2804 domain-containing protein [Flavimaribacter sediminis]
MVTVKTERELTAQVDLCDARGRLNPAAVGWARRPLVRANLRGWGRNKRFEYWCITSPDLVAALNVSHGDYRVTLAGFFLDLKTLDHISVSEVHWLPGKRVPEMCDLSGSGPVIGIGQEMSIRMVPAAGGTQLSLESGRLGIEAFVAEPEDHESMSVVVPWDSKRFQLTRKSNCMKVEGTVIADGKRHDLDPDNTYGTLDHGRGRWPYSIVWNWGSASGHSDGHEIGLQFGGKWTDGTPSTENALRIDGRVFKIGEELEWTYDRSDYMKPWTIRGAGIDLIFTPVFDRHFDFDRMLVRSREDQCFGYYNGTIEDPAGKTIWISDLLGWVEEVHRRW